MINFIYYVIEGGCHRAGRAPGWYAGQRMHVSDSRTHYKREGGFLGDWNILGPLEDDREPSQH